MPSWTIDVTLPAVSDAQQQLVAHLEQVGIAGRASFVITLVFEEVARNLIEHARDGQAGTFDVELTHAAEVSTIAIEDDFAPFDPTHATTDPPPDDLATHTGHGLGVRLLIDMTDELRYERLKGRNRLSATVLHR